MAGWGRAAENCWVDLSATEYSGEAKEACFDTALCLRPEPLPCFTFRMPEEFLRVSSMFFWMFEKLLKTSSYLYFS